MRHPIPHSPELLKTIEEYVHEKYDSTDMIRTGHDINLCSLCENVTWRLSYVSDIPKVNIISEDPCNSCEEMRSKHPEIVMWMSRALWVLEQRFAYALAHQIDKVI